MLSSDPMMPPPPAVESFCFAKALASAPSDCHPMEKPIDSCAPSFGQLPPSFDSTWDTLTPLVARDSTWDALAPLDDVKPNVDFAIEPMNDTYVDSGDELSVFASKMTACESPTEVMADAPLGARATKRSRPTKAKRTAPPVMALVDEPSAVEVAPSLPTADIPALENASTLDESEGAGAEDGSAEVKRQRRMQRNRESAAESRKRKKQRVEELEELIASLQGTVSTLQAQNAELRLECARVATAGCATESCSARAEEPLELPAGA